MENEENKTVKPKPAKRGHGLKAVVDFGNMDGLEVQEAKAQDVPVAPAIEETFIAEPEQGGTVQQVFDHMLAVIGQEKFKNKEYEKEVKDNYSTRLTERQKTMLDQISSALHKQTASDVLGTLIEYFHGRNKSEIKKAIIKKLKL